MFLLCVIAILIKLIHVILIKEEMFMGIPTGANLGPVQPAITFDINANLEGWRSTLFPEGRQAIVDKIVEVLAQCTGNGITDNLQLKAMAENYLVTVINAAPTKRECFEKIVTKLYDLRQKNTAKAARIDALKKLSMCTIGLR